MKKITFSLILACIALTVSAQETIRVNYKGARPSISDFVTAYLNANYNEDVEEEIDESLNAVHQAWDNRLKGKALSAGEKLTVDEKNGYVLYEDKYNDNGSEQLLKSEMCYWNEADGKHKLFAYSLWFYIDGKPAGGQYDGLTFYRYDNATKKMTRLETPPGFKVDYSGTYSLPRTGKDIIFNKWNDSGRKTQKTHKWNGRGFSR